MTVQEVTKIDFLLKDGGLMMVEVRDPHQTIWPLKKIQALMKGFIGLWALKSGAVAGKYPTTYVVWTGQSPSQEMVDFLKRHQFGVHHHHFGGDSNDKKVLVPNVIQNSETASLNVDEKEVNSLMKECAQGFVELRKKDGLVLDYSLDSLKLVDRWLIENAQQIKESLDGNDVYVLAGAYLGEVIIHDLGGKWVMGMGISQFPIYLETNGNKGNCLGKVWKLVNEGSGDETYHFARVIEKLVKEGKI